MDKFLQDKKSKYFVLEVNGFNEDLQSIVNNLEKNQIWLTRRSTGLQFRYVPLFPVNLVANLVIDFEIITKNGSTG